MKALQLLQVLLLVAGLAYLAAFHLANRAGVAYPLPGGPLDAAPSLALLGGFLAGLAYASLLYLPPLVRAGVVARRLRRSASALEAENAALRAAPPAAPELAEPAGERA